MTAAPTPPLADAFASILEGLRRAIAARAAKTPLTVPIFLLLWSRLGRLIRRFESLVVRFEAGRLRPPRAPRPREPGAEEPGARRPRPAAPARPPDAPPQPVLPRWFAWVVGAVPGSGAYGSQLRHLMTQPEMAALLAAAPQAARMLRPLCHMLGIDPPPQSPPQPAAQSPHPPPIAPEPALTTAARQATQIAGHPPAASAPSPAMDDPSLDVDFSFGLA